MAKRPISDLLRALDVVDKLERQVLVHDEQIRLLEERMDVIERRLNQVLSPP